MVKICVNPACRNEFRQLSSGKLYSLETRAADTRFLWLCSQCAPRLTLSIDSAGCVSVTERSAHVRPLPPKPGTRLRLVTGDRIFGHRGTGQWHPVGQFSTQTSSEAV